MVTGSQRCPLVVARAKNLHMTLSVVMTHETEYYGVYLITASQNDCPTLTFSRKTSLCSAVKSSVCKAWKRSGAKS